MSVPIERQAPGDDDRQAAFAATMVDEWVRAGIAHAVVCPGSRSTPLALALAAEPRIEMHLRLDERSAGFMALGIGMATGLPAVVVVTSGTAAAELHAAVVEADMAGVPLLVCTADRPPELRDVGAPQTIDQSHLYGRSVRWFVDPGVPDTATRSSWRSLGSRSVAESLHGPRGPGPVQLNLPFREPLIGDSERGEIPAGRPDGLPWHCVDTGPLAPPIGLADDLVASGGFVPGSRGVIVAGAGCGDASSVLALAELLSWPILADPRSGLRSEHVVIAAADGILRAPGFLAGHRPDVALVLGGRWASKIVTTFVGGAARVVVDPFGSWPDPERSAGRLVRCDPALLCRALTESVAAMISGPPDGLDAGTAEEAIDEPDNWALDWQLAEGRARRVITEALASSPTWTEPALAHLLVAAMPDGVPLVVSSSMPIRDIEAFATPRADPPRVFANRGANGIDGVVSTALGVALASGPTVALVGDLAFLHDVSALVGPAGSAPPLTVVVADNGGGGIFSFLAPATTLEPAVFERLFATPQSPDVAEVAAGFGWAVEDLDGVAGFDVVAGALARSAQRGGGTVIRIRLPNRAANVDAHDRINAAIVAAVDD